MLGRHLNAGSMLAQAVHVVPQAGINGAAGRRQRCRSLCVLFCSVGQASVEPEG